MLKSSRGFDQCAKFVVFVIVLIFASKLARKYYVALQGGYGTVHVVGKANFDFGTVWQNASLKHDFQIVNESNEKIVFMDVKRSCGCTNAELSDLVALPHSTVHLKAELDSHRGFGHIGSRITLVWQVASTGKVEQLNTSIAADVSTPICALPAYYDFGDVDIQEATCTADITLHVNKSQAIWDNIDVSSDTMQVEKRSTVDSNIVLHLTLCPSHYAIGALKDQIIVQPSLNGKTVLGGISIPIQANIIGEVSSKPATVYIGTIDPTKEWEGKLHLTSKARPFGVTRTLSDSPMFIQASAKHLSDLESSIDCHARVSDAVGNLSGFLHVYLSFTDKKEPGAIEIKVPYIAFGKHITTSVNH